MLNLYNIKLTDGSENLFYLAYGMPQSRTSRRAEDGHIGGLMLLSYKVLDNEVKWNRLDNHNQD
jgi:hypothetical protein